MTLVLTALDGTNPLGFLAALGVLTTASTRWPERRTRLGWRPDVWDAVLDVDGDLDREALVHGLWEALHREAAGNTEITDTAKRKYRQGQRGVETRASGIEGSSPVTRRPPDRGRCRD